MDKLTWPAWFNGPKGEAEIFAAPEFVPAGWTSGAEKIKVDGKPAPAKTEQKVSVSKPAADDGKKPEVDADGHPWSADLHAASKSKTRAGLWRLKVGATRPEPMPGYPIQHDL